MGSRRGVVASVVLGCSLVAGAATASTSKRPAVIAVQCAAQAITGPATDVNAQAGDGRITVGLNAAGTITVFRYPNPSFYNQVKYYTSARDAMGNPIGALPN